MMPRRNAAALLALLLSAASTPAFAQALRPAADRQPQGLPGDYRGDTAAVVFTSPAVVAAFRGSDLADRAVRPEATRNDRHLNLRSNEPLTALQLSWPQRQPPTVFRRRFITLPRRSDTFIVFGPANFGPRGFGPAAPFAGPSGGGYPAGPGFGSAPYGGLGGY